MSTRLGMGTEPATDSTATGSGGATMAPSAMAAATVMPGMIASAVALAAATVTTTRPTASQTRDFHLRRMTCQEVRWAAE